MQVEKQQGKNVKASFVEDKGISILTIKDEGELITYDAQKDGGDPVTKLVVGVTFDGQSKNDPKKWSMNAKSQNALIDKWGTNTEKWIGKDVEIKTEGEGEFKHISVDTLRTK